MQASLFAFDGDHFTDVEDWSFLASDRQPFQCIGKPKEIRGPSDESVVWWPCGRILPDLCFIRFPEYALRIQRTRPVHSMCVACELEIRKARKRFWLFETKATTALGHHMTRERKQGLHEIRKRAVYETVTGVTVPILAKTMRQSALEDHPCPHCEVPWSEMLGGWEMNMSLDRTDPKRMLALDNYTLKCRTGNSQRKDANPRAAAVRDAYWRLIRQERRQAA